MKCIDVVKEAKSEIYSFLFEQEDNIAICGLDNGNISFRNLFNSNIMFYDL